MWLDPSEKLWISGCTKNIPSIKSPRKNEIFLSKKMAVPRKQGHAVDPENIVTDLVETKDQEPMTDHEETTEETLEERKMKDLD